LRSSARDPEHFIDSSVAALALFPRFPLDLQAFSPSRGPHRCG
jgi:hypothetical protein